MRACKLSSRHAVNWRYARKWSFIESRRAIGTTSQCGRKMHGQRRYSSLDPHHPPGSHSWHLDIFLLSNCHGVFDSELPRRHPNRGVGPFHSFCGNCYWRGPRNCSLLCSSTRAQIRCRYLSAAVEAEKLHVQHDCAKKSDPQKQSQIHQAIDNPVFW